MSYWIGPVQLVDLFEPQLTQTGSPTALGLQPGQITAQTEWWQAHQLDELVNNPQRRVTIGGVSGVLEPVYFSDPMLGPLTSWVLLQSFQLGQADQTHSLQGATGLVPYTLSLTQVGDATQRQVVLARSARAKGNDFALSAASIVADSFGATDFAVNPGGTLATREYDPVHGQSTTILSAPSAGAMAYRVGTVTGTTDSLALVVLPQLTIDGTDTPTWIANRGGDCRSYNRREQREVYGPSHRIQRPTDLVIRNGRLRAWVGNRGMVPFLNVEALHSGNWREVGVLTIETPDGTGVLNGARLTVVTPEVVTASLEVSGVGPVFVTIRRAGRSIEVVRNDGGQVVLRWRGTPPEKLISRISTAAGGLGTGARVNATADWDDALATWDDPASPWDAGPSESGVLELLWPTYQPNTEWTKALRWTPSKSSALLSAVGLMSLRDSLDAQHVALRWESSDKTFRLKVGAAVEISSSAVTFAAASDIFLAVRLSPTLGAALSVTVEPASVTHVKAAGTTNPGSAAYSSILYATASGLAGDGLAGDGNAGGVDNTDGVVDNAMLFDSYLTDAEVATLAAATTALGGLPTPEARLVWFAPFDCRPLPLRSPVATGRIYETTAQDGTQRFTDANGFTRAVAVLNNPMAAVNNMALKATQTALAYLAIAASQDDLSDHQSQFAAASSQQIRVR